MVNLDIPEICSRTQKMGENWAIAHARRLLRLIEEIAAGQVYEPQAVMWAAYLHDWGAFRHYHQPGCDHAARSRQIAETEILPWVNLPRPTKDLVLEAIERHDYRDPKPVESIEALLVREADFLDFLGVIGIVREFGRGPADLNLSYNRIVARRDLIKDRFTLPQARILAEKRLDRMEFCFTVLMEESFGIL